MTTQDFIAHFALLTGHSLKPVQFAWESDLYLWRKSFEEEDLAIVVNHIKNTYGTDRVILDKMLSWPYLIRQRDRFAELLSEAKGRRKTKHTERDKVLLASGRPALTKPERPARPAGEVLRRMSKDRLSEGWKGILKELDKPTL